MALDRWIALVLLSICLLYGYTAWLTMDANLAPFMQRKPIWPSTFPKVLSIFGIVLSLIILLGLEKAEQTVGEIDYRKLHEYKLGQAILILGLMVVYAICLRPIGFLGSTTAFLVLGSFILGERKWLVMFTVSLLTAGIIWYLVQEVLGIFLRPLPFFLGN
ncbi:putative tricarboxylic transport membrane protein [Yoonia tamlensis]|uniref:Putative tricarboxylic transport membrane protein n=1 Tax=Yoonia tamlensis TaxID=390270 RepID=A0A1I6HE74_9RHOB|nr:tripartite tricarboxylate transporter TctB family protein [Yoonia tamlensis]SFR52796.1 putative tricarboxylic transport membrane protein [Yoonia tamlensis]